MKRCQAAEEKAATKKAKLEPLLWVEGLYHPKKYVVTACSVHFPPEIATIIATLAAPRKIKGQLVDDSLDIICLEMGNEPNTIFACSRSQIYQWSLATGFVPVQLLKTLDYIDVWKTGRYERLPMSEKFETINVWKMERNIVGKLDVYSYYHDGFYYRSTTDLCSKDFLSRRYTWRGIWWKEAGQTPWLESEIYHKTECTVAGRIHWKPQEPNVSFSVDEVKALHDAIWILIRRWNPSTRYLYRVAL